ncbi:MAG: signal recognition particle-docking protein FtsY [Chloroflexi bacterium]|nr:signal recognition particle-docking protein FtsY [Chloroflexota bacterium]
MFRDSLKRTRQAFFGRVAQMLGATEIDEETWEDIEALLVQADMGISTATSLVETLRERVTSEGLTTRDQLESALKDELRNLLADDTETALATPRLLTVILIVGVNGSGKTTSIAKLAHRFKQEGRAVILAAADTFRAAAIEQLQTWGERADVPVIAGQPNGDPGAVTYDAIRSARARKSDLLIVDTAGRLHTNYNLMKELEKIHTVARKNVHEAPHEVWLVVDGTTGQNALNQAKHFKDAVEVTGVIVTKLDSTARGGMVFAIGHDLDLPVRYIGVGEGLEDLLPFDPDAFVDSLFEE